MVPVFVRVVMGGLKERDKSIFLSENCPNTPVVLGRVSCQRENGMVFVALTILTRQWCS